MIDVSSCNSCRDSDGNVRSKSNGNSKCSFSQSNHSSNSNYDIRKRTAVQVLAKDALTMHNFR